MSRLLRYLRPYKGKVAWAIGLLTIESVLELAPPFITKLAIDRYIAPTGDVAIDVRYAGLLKVVGLLAGALLVGFLAAYLHGLIMSLVGQRVMFDMRMQIFRRLQRLDIPFFDRNPVGRSDDATHQRRRDTERNVHLGCRGHPARHLHAHRHHRSCCCGSTGSWR